MWRMVSDGIRSFSPLLWHFILLISYTRGLQTFSAGGHIDDFFRLGGPNVQKISIYLKHGEWLRGYLFLSYDSYDAEQR